MKLIAKRTIVILMIICALLSLAPSGRSFAAESEVILTQERAGNFVSNFAINFYNNWNEYSDGSGNKYYSTYNSTMITIPTANDSLAFSNLSWIDFVYSTSLGIDNNGLPSKFLNSSRENGNYEEIAKDDLADIMKIPGTVSAEEKKDLTKAISDLMNNGKILPGDILYTTEHEYLLYVGGTKVTYATKPTANNTGAIKYDYIHNYFNAVNKKLLDEHQDEEDYKPQYGVLHIYRIKQDYLNDAHITDVKATTIFNNKGYYDQKTKYSGIPEKGAYAGSTHEGLLIFDFLGQLVKFLGELILYMIRGAIVGWVNIFESIIQSIVLHLSGNTNPVSFRDKWSGVNSSYLGTRVTVESLLYNQLPLTDANFFNTKTAGGFPLVDEQGQPISWLYTIRLMLAKWYYIIRNASIALMLIMLLYMAVRYLISSVPGKKADIKRNLKSWFVGFLIVLFIHYFMYAVLYCNDRFVEIIKEMSNGFASNALGIETAEATIYDAVRTKAYEFNFFDGTAGLILYIILVYFFVRYLIIYLKRMVAVYVLGLMGSFMGVKYAFDTAAGRPSQSMSKWFKDFTFNVLLQTIHGLLYGTLMMVAFQVAITSFSGLLMSIIIMQVILAADKIIMKIFKIQGAFLEDVNKPEGNYITFITRFSLYKYMITAPFKFGKNMITGEGKTAQLFKYAKYYKSGLSDSDIAEKIEASNMRKKAWAGKTLYNNRLIQKLPIKYLKRRGSGYQKLYDSLKKGGPFETQREMLNSLKVDKTNLGKKFTRPIDASKIILSGMFHSFASVGLLAEGGSLSKPTGGVGAIHQALKATQTFSSKDKQKLRMYAKAHPGTMPGALGDLQMNAAKLDKNREKAIAQNATVEQIIDEELELNNVFERIKGNGNILSKKEAIELIKRTIRASDTGHVPAEVIKASVNRFLAENVKKEKIETEADVKEVLTNVNKILRKNGSDVYLNEEMKDAITSLVSGSIGAGLDVKECTSLLSETIATSDVVPVLGRGKIEKAIYDSIFNAKFKTKDVDNLPTRLDVGDTYEVTGGAVNDSYTWDGKKWIDTSTYTGVTNLLGTVSDKSDLQKRQLNKGDVVEVNDGTSGIDKYKYDGTSWMPYDDMKNRFDSSTDFKQTREDILHDKICEDGDINIILNKIKKSISNYVELDNRQMKQIKHAIEAEIGGNLSNLNGRSMEEVRDIMYDAISRSGIIKRVGDSEISGELEEISRRMRKIYAKNEAYKGKNKDGAVDYGAVRNDIVHRMEDVIRWIKRKK